MQQNHTIKGLMLNKQGYKVSQGVLNNFSQASPPTKFELGIRSDNLLIKSFKIVFQSSSNSYFYPLLYVDKNNKEGSFETFISKMWLMF